MSVVNRSTQEIIEMEVRIAARPETVFPFLTEVDKMVRWMGWVDTQIDARPGGIFRSSNNRDMTISGSYVEVVPNERVVLTWGWEGSRSLPSGASRVEVTLAPDGQGTLLRLRHLDLPEGERDSHAQGWEHYIPRLVIVATGGDPGPDPWAQ